MFDTRIEYLTYNISEHGRILKLVLLIAIEVIALFGNSFFISAIFYRKPITKQSRTYIYLSFVSLMNLGAAIFVIPFPIITLVTGKWILSHEFCYFNGFMGTFWLTSNVFSITLLSVHKYLSIVRPMQRGEKTYKPILYRIIFTVFLSLVVTTIPFVENRVYFNPYTAQCAIKLDQVGYVSYMILSVYFIPTVINVLVYFRIVIALKKHSNRMRFTTFYNPRLLEEQKRMMKTLYICFLSFIFSWTPFFIYAILFAAKHKSASSIYFLFIAYIAGFSNSAANPLIFIFRNLRIQNTCATIFKEKKIPTLSLVPSISRSHMSLEDRRSSYFCTLPTNFLAEEDAGTTNNSYKSDHNEYIAEQSDYIAEQNGYGNSVVLTSFQDRDTEIQIKFHSVLEVNYLNNLETKF